LIVYQCTESKRIIYSNRGIVKKRRYPLIFLQERGIGGKWKTYRDFEDHTGHYISSYNFEDLLLEMKEDLRQRAISIARLELKKRTPVLYNETSEVYSSSRNTITRYDYPAHPAGFVL